MHNGMPSDYLKHHLKHYQWQGQSIPSYMHDGLLRYLEFGTRPGEFLFSVLCGDLFAAFRYADTENEKVIGVYAAFLYNWCDPRCFGSKEKVLAWLDVAKLQG